jgi:phage shock protein A
MARGALSRVANIIRADLDEMLNRMEDPKKLIPYLIREMEEAVETAVDEAAGAVANERSLERRLGHTRERVETWQAKAEAAVASGDDARARKALEQRLLESSGLDDLEAALAESRKATADLKQQLANCRSKLQGARSRHRTLVARSAATALRRTDRPGAAPLNTAAFQDYDRLVDTVAAEEAAAEVYEQMAGSASELDSDFEKLEKEQKVDEALREMKRKLGPTA